MTTSLAREDLSARRAKGRNPFASRRRMAHAAVGYALGAQVLAVAVDHMGAVLDWLQVRPLPAVVGYTIVRLTVVGLAALLAASIGTGLTTALRFVPRRRLGRLGLLALCASASSVALLAWVYRPEIWL